VSNGHTECYEQLLNYDHSEVISYAAIIAAAIVTISATSVTGAAVSMGSK